MNIEDSSNNTHVTDLDKELNLKNWVEEGSVETYKQCKVTPITAIKLVKAYFNMSKPDKIKPKIKPVDCNALTYVI